MKALQFDDIYDELNKHNRVIKYYYKDKIVYALNKSHAVERFKSNYNLLLTKKQITNDYDKRIIA